MMNPKQARQANQDQPEKDLWETPNLYIDRVRKTLGGTIPYDLASSSEANKRIKAKQYFSYEKPFQVHYMDSPLWKRGFWVNPPFSQMKDFSRIISEARKESKIKGLVLCNNNTETVWFQNLLQNSDQFLLLNHRIQFITPAKLGSSKQNNPAQQTIFAYGCSLSQFRDLGSICKFVA